MQKSDLHVIAVIANPVRWRSRLRLFKDFAEHMLDSGVSLTVVECAYGERAFDCALPHLNHVPVRAKTLLWNKENLQNIGVMHSAGRYFVTADADIRFRQKDWVYETLHALQQYDVVQPWGEAYDLGPNDEHLATHRGLMKLWCQGRPVVQGPGTCAGYEFGHPGYAWAWTRQALEWLGGFIETAVLGAADHHMGMGLIGKAEATLHPGVSANYKRDVRRWQTRALHHINMNVGYVPGTIEHYWHGKKERRFYIDRWQVLVENGYDPDLDLKKNTYGVLELAGNKPRLRRQLDQYFRSRDEDGNSLD